MMTKAFGKKNNVKCLENLCKLTNYFDFCLRGAPETLVRSFVRSFCSNGSCHFMYFSVDMYRTFVFFHQNPDFTFAPLTTNNPEQHA